MQRCSAAHERLRRAKGTHLALAGCSLILSGRGLMAQEPLPADYIRPGPITAREKAPGLRSQLLSQGGSRTYAIIFGKYDEFMAGLTEFAENNQLKASRFTAIGASHEALFGWFDGAALKQNAASPHYKHLELTVGDLLEEPFEVNILKEVLSLES